MTDKVLIHRLNADPIEVDPDLVHWVDHSRMLDGLCSRKRFLRYHLRDTGVVAESRNDELGIGGAIHEGLDLMFQGGSLDKALEVARDYWQKLPPYPSYVFPEQAEIMAADGIHLAWAFIYGFSYAYLPQLLNEYEILEVEEEINWLLTTLYPERWGKKYIVMMSRPDGVLRSKSTGRLWHMSHKSYNGQFNDLKILQLETDSQRMAESLAIASKYGEQVEGTIYNYFLKGRKYLDQRSGVERVSSGLIRPYLQRQGPGGEILPGLLSYEYEWEEMDKVTYEKKNRRLGKGWERVSIYNEMDFWTYLSWLQHGMIKPPDVENGRDYLAESIAGNVPVYFNYEQALRWMEGATAKERHWAYNLAELHDSGDPSFEDPEAADEYNSLFPLEQSQCFSYNRPCSYHGVCWKGIPVDYLLEAGHMTPRSANHMQEQE